MNGSETSSPPDPRRRRRGRRVVRRLAIALAVVVVLFAFLHLSSVQRLVGNGVVWFLTRNTGVHVSFERFAYRLWAGEMSVDGLSVRQPRVMITCPRMVVRLSASGVRLQIVDARLVARQAAESDTSRRAPSRPWSVVGRFAAIDVERGALEMQDRQGAAWLRADGINARIDRTTGRSRAPVHVERADIAWPEAALRVPAARADAEVEIDPSNGGLRLVKGRITADATELRASGRLDQLDPIIGRADASGQIDALMLTHAVPGIAAEGALDVRLSIARTDLGASGTIEIDTPHLTVAHVGPWSGKVRSRIDRDRLVVDSVDVRGAAAQISANGVVPLGDGVSALDVRVRAPSVSELAEALTASRLPIASHADVDFHVQLENWKLDSLAGAGHLRLSPRAGRGCPVSGESDLKLSARRLSFAARSVNVRHVQLEADGAIAFPADFSVNYAVQLPDLREAPALLTDLSIATPHVDLTGKVAIAGTLIGKLPKWESRARMSTDGLAIEGVNVDLDTELVLNPEGIHVESLVVQGRDGHLAATGFVPFKAGEWAVEATAANVQLREFLSRHGIPLDTRFGGKFQIDGPAASPRGRFTLEGDVADHSDARAHLHTQGSVTRQALAIEHATADPAGGRVDASGTWNWIDQTVTGRLSVKDVALEKVPLLPVAREAMTATLSADVAASGPVRAPVGRASMTLTANTFRSAALPDVMVEATSNGQVTLVTGRIGTRPFLTGRLPLVEPSSLHLDIDLAELPIMQVVRTLPAFRNNQFSLAVDGNVSLDFPVSSPRDFQYEANVRQVDARIRHLWRAGAFNARGDMNGFDVEGLTLTEDEGGRLEADGHVSFDDPSPNAGLDVRGELPLSNVAAFLTDAELEGTAGFDLRMTGPITRPDLDGTVQLAARSGRVGRVRWSGARAEGTLDHDALKLDKAWVGLMGGDVVINGTVPLGGPAQNRKHEFDVEASGIDFATLLETSPRLSADQPSPPASALVDLTARFSATEPSLDTIEGEGQLKRIAFSRGAASVRLESPVEWHLRNGAFSHSTMRLRGVGGTALDVTAKLRFDEAVPHALLGLTGQVSFSDAQPLLPNTARLEGLARLGLQVEAGPGALSVTGDARIEAGGLVLRDPPLAVEGVTGTIKATGRRVEITDVKASVGDGRLTAAGEFSIPTSAKPEINIGLELDRVPLTYPEGLRSRTSGKVRLVGGEGRYRIEGDTVVHRAVYNPPTDSTSESLQRVTGELSALDARGSLLDGVDLNIAVRLEDGVRIENARAQLVVDGAVRIGGDLLTPEVHGSLVLRDGGRVKLSRALLRISQGRIELSGFPARPPDVNIEGRTQVTGVLIEVNATGPLDNFGLSLSAPNRPDLTQGDLASLILTGRTASTAVSEGGAIVAEQLAATLGEAVESGLGGAVFIDVARDEDLIVQDTNPSQRLNIGVPVGRRLYVIYSQALDHNAPRWIIELRPAGEFRVRFISDSSDGSEAIEVAHRFSFNVWSRRGNPRKVTEPAARIDQVLFKGVPPQSEADLRKVVKIQPGSKFDYFHGEEAARTLAAALRRQGYRAAAVEVADRETAPGHVDVTVTITRGARFDIQWRGDDPGRTARRRVEQGWGGSLPVEESAAKLADETRRVLQSDRYYAAAVTPQVTGSPEQLHVIFDVRRGPRGSRIEIGFEGNEAVSRQTLSAALPATDTEAFFSLLERPSHPRLASAIRLAYAREGFLHASTGVPRQQFDAASGVLTVTIPIEQGPRAKVIALDVPSYARAPEDTAPVDLKTSVGDPFRIGDYIEDRNRVVAWYREQGYPEARVTGILEPADGGLAVRFGVESGPRVRVGDVRVAREGHTRPSVVRDAVTLAPGDLLRPAELTRSRQRLSETGVFRSVDVRPDAADADAATRDVVVDLTPRDDVSLEYSIRYTKNGAAAVDEVPSSETSNDIQLGAALEVSNPFGFAHRYRLYGLIGGERALVGLTFDSASFLDYRWRTQVFLFDDQDLVPDIPRLIGRIQGVTFQQTKRWRDELGPRQWQDPLRMSWGFTYKHVRYSDPATAQTLSGDRAGLIHSLSGDTRDSMTDPHRGVFWSIGTELALRGLGSDVNYLKQYDQFYCYVPLGSRVVWAQGYRLGVAPGDDPLLLLEGRFHAGGASSVRGFAENTLGPLTKYGEPLGGQALAIFNQELRFPVFRRLWGGLFYDAGNTFALASELALDALRQSAGAGFRFMFPFGPVRLDYAWVLDPHEGEKRSRWVFSLGHAF